MKLISVQSRGNRIAKVERFEIFGSDYVLTKKKIQSGDKSFRKSSRLISYVKRTEALKAAAKWLEGATA